MRNRWAAMALGVCIGLAAPAAQQQSANPAALPPLAAQPIPLYKVGLGTFSRKISSSNAEAQAYFDQGFQLMYSFGKYEAVRSFREAWKRDPGCAICYWGEAWAWGSNLNQVMSAGESPFAFAAVQKALSIKENASPSERALIEAIAHRYVERFDVSTRGEQDAAYARAMEKVFETYPDDLDVGTLYADALFHLVPRPGPPPGRRPRLQDLDSPNVRRIHEVLERLLARDPRHPGACHWYVHATEATAKAAAAQPCADFLGRSIPGASHINHMPSHTFNEVGRWGDSVRANIDAWHSDLKASAGEGFAIYPSHNLHMLVYAAAMDGQGAIAMRAGKDYAKLTRGDTMFQLLALIRFGRFDEVLEIATRPESDIPAGAGNSPTATRSCAAARPKSHAGTSRISGGSPGLPPRPRTSVPVTPPAGCLVCWSKSSKGRLPARPATPRRPSPHSSGPWPWMMSSTWTNPSRCRSRRATGSGQRCSTRRDLLTPNACTWPICGNTLTTGGRCSDCSSR